MFAISVVFIALFFIASFANTIHVPSEVGSIQDGINLANEGDTVLIAPGEYHEQLLLQEKSIVLGSWYLQTGDTSYIAHTIIDGDNNNYVLKITGPGEGEPSIIGITIRNGDDGITASKKKFLIMNSYVRDCTDGIDYESGSGGKCYQNVFVNNNDDGIDLDGAIDIVIADNVIRNNDDDGIEIRLHEYSGAILNYTIKNNIISGNGEDGIQLIDYPDLSDRVFYIERNIFHDNAMVGLGCMSGGNTKENYEGADIPEPIYLMNNTFINNNYGVTGGGKMYAVNNLVTNSEMIAMKNISNNSIISYSNFWGNGVIFENCNLDSTHLFYEDPLLDEDFKLQLGSICIDHGISLYILREDTILNIDSENYERSAPDIGAFEYGNSTRINRNIILPKKYYLSNNYPNPFNETTHIKFGLPKKDSVTIDIYNIEGQKVLTLFKGTKAAGYHVIKFKAGHLTSGLYFYRIQTSNFIEVKKMIMVK